MTGGTLSWRDAGPGHSVSPRGSCAASEVRAPSWTSGAWLRSLGLERYEVAFRENAIAADVLRDLTDQDLEKIGVLLGDRRRLLRAIAALDEAPASPTSPAPAPPVTISAAAASPISAEVEVSGERPNVVTLRANQTPLSKADVCQRGLGA